MTMEEVMSLIRVISGFSDEVIDYYYPLVEMYFSKYSYIEVQQSNRQRALLLVAARIYYEISKIRVGSDISSFKAGDISVSSNDNEVERAKGIYFSALENAADLIEDVGFVFRSV